MAAGAKLFEEVGSKRTKQGRRAWRRLYTKHGNEETEHPRGAIDKLMKRGLLIPAGPRPKQDCFNPETRKVELLLQNRED